MIAQLILPINELREDVNQHLSAGAASVISDRASKLFDLLRYRVEHDKDINEIVRDLKEEVFELRMAVLSNYTDLAETLQSIISKEIANNTLVLIDDKEISEVYREVLALYAQIIGDRLAVPSSNDYVEDLPMKYRLYKEFLKQFPQSLAERLYSLLDHSLEYELALILMSMLLDRQIKLKAKTTKQLIKLVRKSIENVGFYSALLDIWQPTREDESPLVRNIKIRLAIEELGAKRSPVELKDINSMFTA